LKALREAKREEKDKPEYSLEEVKKFLSKTRKNNKPTLCGLIPWLFYFALTLA